MRRAKLKNADIQAGKALPYAICDESGQRLFNKGAVIASRHQLDALLKRGVYRYDDFKAFDNRDQSLPLEDKPSPFHLYVEICGYFENLLTYVDESKLRVHSLCNNFESRVMRLVDLIQQLCRYDADAAIAAVVLVQNFSYPVYHPVQVAILSELVSNRLGFADPVRRSLVAGALTQNLSMSTLQNELSTQYTPLSLKQKSCVNSHPSDSVKILRSAGINDGIWLDVVMHHHECLNGAGYPDGLNDALFRLEAQIVGIGDRFGAKISDRAYRKGLTANVALKDLFTSKMKDYQEALILTFIKELGVYPPGSVVELLNGETAIVIRRQSGSPWPLVESFKDSHGNFYPKSFTRDSNDTDCSIKYIVENAQFPKLNYHQLWGYC